MTTPSPSATSPPEPRRSPRGDEIGMSPTKRRRHEDSQVSRAPRRREAACQTCRLRKVKCDKTRPCCSACKSSNATCEYPDDPSDRLTLERATTTLSRQLCQIQTDIDSLKSSIAAGSGLRTKDEATPPEPHCTRPPTPATLEPSRDFLQIPPHKTSADTVLEWEIFEGKYPRNALIGTLFRSNDSRVVSPGGIPSSPSIDGVTGPTGLQQLDDERIPSLIDCFLQNVHTKNPIVDVESLVKHGRRCAAHGVGWHSQSCLVLLACALGSVAKPFDIAAAQRPSLASSPANCSAQVYAKELQHAETCFALACRRLGSLKPTVLGVQCYFFAGVYLMYTMRPLLSWQYFFHASTLYYLYTRIARGLEGGHMEALGVHGTDRKARRIEQSLYWSCFKSECEFRVELPFPQSEISAGEHPNLFPSPPSPVVTETANISTTSPLNQSSVSNEGSAHFGTYSKDTAEEQELRRHAKGLCKEEESWYYYLTEVALRRIGNRIINTFFRHERSSWLNIKPYLRLAQEFEAQVSSWSAHLPVAMQQYETTSAIRAPRLSSRNETTGSHVTRELSWAIDNRLLEMQTWLYQPFLYYLVHVGLGVASPTSIAGYPYRSTGIGRQPIRSGHISNLLNPSLHQDPRTAHSDTLNPSTGLLGDGRTSNSLDNEDLTVLHSLITSGIECNLKTLDVRSHGHRHHGLWYDLRSIMCASLVLLAVVKSGNAAWIPGGAETLWGPGTTSGSEYWSCQPSMIGGKIAKVLAQFNFWTAESPDLVRWREVLEEIVKDVRGS